jgi:hypothetical protein
VPSLTDRDAETGRTLGKFAAQTGKRVDARLARTRVASGASASAARCSQCANQRPR